MRATDTVFLKCLLFEGGTGSKEILYTSQLGKREACFARRIVLVFMENHSRKFLFSVWYEFGL